jgi:hypothetical protein
MIVSVGPREQLDTSPAHPGGGPWRYAVMALDGSVTFADSAGELVAVSIPAYAEIPDTDEGHDEALVARYEHLVTLAASMQDSLIAQALESDRVDLSDAGEDILTALFADRATPFEGILTPKGGVDLDWQFEIPLVLVATDYTPFTERELPTGRVVWVDPSTEVTFLNSLKELGVIEMFLVAPDE